MEYPLESDIVPQQSIMHNDTTIIIALDFLENLQKTKQ
jgi:hypothetical protein